MDNRELKKNLMRWGVRNLIAGGVMAAAFAAAVQVNTGYKWLWHDYTSDNLNAMRADSGLNDEDKLVNRLGLDYRFVLTVKGMTPENAVIFYPSREDFLASPTHGAKLPLRGTMVDKVSAIRVLYPRRVVVAEEMGQTPYAQQISHIAVVNGRHRDMVSYPCDTMPNFDVLPTNAADYIPY